MDNHKGNQPVFLVLSKHQHPSLQICPLCLVRTRSTAGEITFGFFSYTAFCGLIIFLQTTKLPRGSTYNFSLCNHDEIQEDLLNVLDPNTTFKKEVGDFSSGIGGKLSGGHRLHYFSLDSWQLLSENLD